MGEMGTTGLSPAIHYDSGGVMATAGGLVFQGRKDGLLYIYDASTGVELRRIDLSTSMAAAPMTYSAGGEQYIAVMAGVIATPGFTDFKYINKGRIVALKLGGGDVPKHPEIDGLGRFAPSVSFESNPKQLEAGEKLYQGGCAVCHEEAGRAPDLTLMSERTHKEFMDIVLKGLRVDKGMGDFSAVLSEDDAKAIHAYVARTGWKSTGLVKGRVFLMPSQ